MIFYTIDCPRCKVLEEKLKKQNISYTECKDIEKMKSLGITTAPMLEIEDGIRYNYFEAVQYLNELRKEDK